MYGLVKDVLYVGGCTSRRYGGYDASKRVSIKIELLDRLKLSELLRYAAFKFIAHKNELLQSVQLGQLISWVS